MHNVYAKILAFLLTNRLGEGNAPLNLLIVL